MNANLKDRLSRLFRLSNGVETILIANTNQRDPNFTYLTGLKSGLYEQSFLIVKKNSIILVTKELEYETAMEQKPSDMSIIKLEDKKKTREIILANVKGKSVGINGSFITYELYNSITKDYNPIKLIDVSNAFIELRMIKGDDEIKAIRKAVGITKKTMHAIKKSFRVGVTEKQLAAEFDDMAISFGSDGEPTFTIVAFGKNAALPHHSPDNTKLKYGDFIVIDAGSKFDNYCSDITRTFIFGDKKKIKDYDRKIKIYNTVKEAQELAINSIKPGILGNVPYNIALKHIDKAENGKYKGTFIHSLGHSIGIDEHDACNPMRPLSEESRLKLRKGMILSVEPGIYIVGFGGVRIEDDILITKEGAAIL